MISYESANLLAAVSVALMSDTSVALAAQMLPEGHVLRSAAYLDAVKAVKKIIDLRVRIASLEAERDKLKESISHFSGLLGGETQKRYALESERDRLMELLKRYIDKHDDYIPCTDYACDICNLNDQAKALIGGEVKNG